MTRSSLSYLAVAALLAGCASSATVQDTGSAGPSVKTSASTGANAPAAATTGANANATAAANAQAAAAERARANPSASVHVLGVPPGHLPRAGQCRVWVPGMPPGRQQKSRSCRGIMESATAGSMVLYRASSEPSVVHVHYMDNVRSDVVVAVREFNASNGAFLREGSPRDHRDEMYEAGDDTGRGRGRNDDRGRQRP